MAVNPIVDMRANEKLKNDKTIKRINKLRTDQPGKESCYVVAQSDGDRTSVWDLEPYGEEGSNLFKVRHK